MPVAIAWSATQQIGTNIQHPKVRIRILASVTVFAMFLVCVIGAKPAAGSHHLIPFIPSLAYFISQAYAKYQKQCQPSNSATAQKLTGLSMAISAWLISACIIAATSQIFVTLYLFATPNEGTVIEADLKSIMAQYAGYTIQMGYGEDSGHSVTFFRPWLYKNHAEYFIDSMALMDMQAAGLEIPDSTLSAFSDQQFDIWLIPRQNAPFQMHNWYDRVTPLFAERLPKIFEQNYFQARSSEYYDIWVAKRLSADEAFLNTK